MLQEIVKNFQGSDVSVVVCHGVPYFRAIDVTQAMGYADSSQAIRKNVQPKYVKSWTELSEMACNSTSVDLSDRLPDPSSRQIGQNATTAGFKQASYVNESGMYELFWHSRKPQALRFREWLVEEVLPSIRKTGKYVKEKQVSLMNETDLHYKVVEFIRRFWMEAIIVPGLGELQDTSTKRQDSLK